MRSTVNLHDEAPPCELCANPVPPGVPLCRRCSARLYAETRRIDLAPPAAAEEAA